MYITIALSCRLIGIGIISIFRQSRRRFLKSGTAIERHRRSVRAEGSSGGRAREGVKPPLVRRVRGIPPPEIFLNLSCLQKRF